MTAPTVSWKDVACTTCGAPINQRCMARGRWVEPHSARVVAAVLASMPVPPQLGYTDKDGLHIVSDADKTAALCRAELVSVPLLQPPFEHVCQNCLRKLAGVKPATEPMRTGVCPVCVSEEDLDDNGLIGSHNQMYGTRRTDEKCPGKGMAPEVTP